MKEEKSLEKSEIKYGELHIYYPLKFDTKLEIEEICQKICQSSMVFNQKYQEKLQDISVGLK